MEVSRPAQVESARTYFSTGLKTYLDTIWTVAFTENHHLVGVDELLYSRPELSLPGVSIDGRHFAGAGAGTARIDGWLGNHWNWNLSLSVCTDMSVSFLQKKIKDLSLTWAPLTLLSVDALLRARNFSHRILSPSAPGALALLTSLSCLIPLRIIKSTIAPPAESVPVLQNKHNSRIASSGCWFTCRKSTIKNRHTNQSLNIWSGLVFTHN